METSLSTFSWLFSHHKKPVIGFILSVEKIEKAPLGFNQGFEKKPGNFFPFIFFFQLTFVLKPQSGNYRIFCLPDFTWNQNLPLYTFYDSECSFFDLHTFLEADFYPNQQNSEPHKIAKMVFLELLDSAKSCKIWVTEILWNFHTVCWSSTMIFVLL